VTTARKLGADLVPGDALRFLSDTHIIARLEPASAKTCEVIPGGLRAVAVDDDWAMTIDPDNFYDVWDASPTALTQGATR
jgi:hypothetical protein